MPMHRSQLSRRALLIGGGALALTARLATARTAQPAPPIDMQARLVAFLAALPARDFATDAPIAYYYGDLAGQLASLGIDPLPVNRVPEDPPEGFFEATLALPLASRAFQSGFTPAWFETFGFSPLAVEQALELASPPNIISLFRGGYDRARVEAALEASGYTEMVQETGGSYWTVGDEIDLTSPVGQLGVGAMNHAVVDDDLLIFARQETDLQQVTWTRAGYEPSMVEQGLWTGMLPMFSPDTVGLIPVGPAALASVVPDVPEATPSGTPEATGGIEYLAFGARAGGRAASLSLVGEGTPESTATAGAGLPTYVEVRIRYGDPALAAREAGAIPERWESERSLVTQQPFTERMTLTDARVHDLDARVVAIDLTSDSPNRWIQMLHTQDLHPFTPAEG